MQKINAVYCECRREIFELNIATNTKNNLCIKCNINNKTPIDDWQVTIETKGNK